MDAHRGVSDPPGPGGRPPAAFGRGVAHAPAALSAPVAHDRRGFGRHKPPPVGVSYKSRCPRRLQTPLSPRMRHTSAAPRLRVTLGEGEHSAERAFPPAFPLLNPLGGNDQAEGCRGVWPRTWQSTCPVRWGDLSAAQNAARVYRRAPAQVGRNLLAQLRLRTFSDCEPSSVRGLCRST